ncbi:MAG: ribokinase [Chloroflexi bacterium]|nr:ribokinase [Chloroflexota bacterium]
MSRQPNIAVIGSIIMDLAVTTPRVPQTGENLLAHGFQMGPGGKGANSAVALARMGAHSTLLGRVGDDPFGRAELETVRQAGVDTSAVVIDPERHTGIAIIMVDDQRENTILVAIGANAGLDAAYVEQALAARWSSLDAVLVNFEIPEEVVRTVIEGARQHHVPAVVDAGPPRHYGPETWRHATVLSPNMLEASYLVGYPVEDEAAARRAAADILALGPQAVVVKMGKRGALLVTPQASQLVPGYAVEVVDTTGAGDAFTSALTLALAEGQALPEAVRLGNAAGALAVTRFGTMAAMPTRAEVDTFKSRG